MGQENCHPQPGDLIEIDQLFHQHWALYLGDGYVINLTPAGEEQALFLAVLDALEFIRKVKKQLLREVVGNHEWRVNSKYDKYCIPLPVEEIIQCAEGYIDKEVIYRVFGSNCERFVTMLRYGGQLRDFVHGELHIPELAHGMRYPDPGDLIEIEWPNHHHWALYMGDGYVIHVTSVDENVLPVSASTVTIFTEKVKVKKELLRKVVGNDEWHVNNKYDWYCTPLPVEIIWCAEGYIDKEVPYEEFGRKCEHFVKRLRYVGQLSNFVRAKMDIPERAHGMHYPDPGDLIEIKRKGYQHWALYVGKGYVIHVTDVDENVPPVSASNETIPTRKVKVKKELLTHLARHDEWRVNREHDCCNIPPVEEIVWRAEGYIGKELPYDVFGSKCGRFVKRLRYGGHVVNCTCGETHFPEKAHGMHYPNPGDLIEIKRKGYQHWALYAGKGYVIHVTRVAENAPALSASSETIVTGMAMVKKQLLTKVVKNDRWHVNNKYDLKACAYPVEEILRRAARWIDKVVPYHLFRSNCEHFVTMLRYEVSLSGQVLNVYSYFTPFRDAAEIGLDIFGIQASNSVPSAAARVGSLADIGFLSSPPLHMATCRRVWISQNDTIERMCC